MDVHDMRELCWKTSVRGNVRNLLKNEDAARIYKVSLALWTVFKMLHVVMVLCDVTEERTFLAGYLSVISQSVATGSSFVLIFSSAEAFAAEAFQGDKACVCYYQLGDVRSALAMLTPCLLLATYLMKLIAFVKSLAYGDFLYLQSYDVPYNVVRATSGKKLLIPF